MVSLFKKYNPNPKGKKVGDCVVRALCCITETSNWIKVYDELCEIGRELYCMPNDKECYEEYLKRHGWSWTYLKIQKGMKRPTVSKFTKDNPKGNYLLVVANHLVGTQDGRYFDSWDSGNCCLYGYWSKK